MLQVRFCNNYHHHIHNLKQYNSKSYNNHIYNIGVTIMQRRVRPGDRSLPAGNLNLQSEAARQASVRLSGGASRTGIGQTFSSSYRPHDPDVIYVRNDTGCDLNKFDPVGLDYLINDLETPTYASSRPNYCRHAGRFAILTSSLKNNTVGMAVISGVSGSFLPQMGNPESISTSASYSTTPAPGFSVDAGFTGNINRIQRAIGLNPVGNGGSASVLHYDDIGSQYQDFGYVKLGNASPELIEASRGRCRCADGSCTYQCQLNDDTTYSWNLYRQDCERADIKFSRSSEISSDPSNSTSCSCPDIPFSTSRTCNSLSIGQFLTDPCLGPEDEIGTVEFTDDDAFCGEYCLWQGEQLIRGCDESCNSDCACISPLELGPLTQGITRPGNRIPRLIRTPCLNISEGGVCIHMASSTGWTEVYNNCSAACPCEEPSASASLYPAGYRYRQECNRARCIPCSPAGKCSWRYNEIAVQNGIYTVYYAKWTPVGSTCIGGCECNPNPPGPEGLVNTAPVSYQRYEENEIVSVPCCKSPYGKPCGTTTVVPTTSSTTSSTTTVPPGSCGCTNPAHYCERTCDLVNIGSQSVYSWRLTYSLCCGTSYPKYCGCRTSAFIEPYPCNAGTYGQKAYSACEPLPSSTSGSAATAVTNAALVSYFTTTTTTTSTTTGYPVVSPSTTPEITAAYPIVNSAGTTIQPTCRVMCIKTFPSLNSSGEVYQSGYFSLEVGTEDGLCSRFGSDNACILVSPCNESSAGQIIEGICRRVDRNV